MRTLLVISPNAPGRFDGVADYAFALGQALAARSTAGLVSLADPGGARRLEDAPQGRLARLELSSWRDLWRRRREPPFVDCVPLLQYVPQLYVSRPDAPWLLLWLAAVRLHGRPVLVTVHEHAIPVAVSLRRIVARPVLALLMLLLGTVASHLVVTFDLPRRRLSRLLFWKRRRIAIVPVGSNVDVAAGVDGPIGTGTPPTCVLFGQPAAMSVTLVSAVGGWARRRAGSVRVRWIGRSEEEIRDFWSRACGLPDTLVEVDAGQPAARVSALLAASDLFLAPLVDGVSTRRTTVIAALAHGLPIVGTDGPCTDDVFRDTEACALGRPSDGEGFVQRLERLLEDRPARDRMRRAARSLFEARFTWERIADAYVSHLS